MFMSVYVQAIMTRYDRNCLDDTFLAPVGTDASLCPQVENDKRGLSTRPVPPWHPGLWSGPPRYITGKKTPLGAIPARESSAQEVLDVTVRSDTNLFVCHTRAVLEDIPKTKIGD